jgi:HSP20 family protein
MIWPIERVNVTVDPFAEFNRLYRTLNNVYGARTGGSVFPAVNVWSNEHETVVSAELPGVDPKEVSISVNENVLTIEGERKADELAEADIQIRRERSVGPFTRSLRLPFEVETDKITARYENGLLHVRLPRREATKPRKIEITTV